MVVAAALLFSTGGAAIKLTALSTWQVACFRSGVAALLLAALASSWRDCLRPRVLVVGAAFASVMILYVAGNKLTTAANAIFLQNTSLVWVLLLSPILLRERAQRSDLGFVAVAALGTVLLLIGADPPMQTAPRPVAGNLLATLAGLGWGLTILGLRWLASTPGAPRQDLGASAVLTGNVIACLVCVPFAFPIGASGSIDWLVVGYLGLFQIGLAYVFMMRGVKRLPAIEVALLLLLEPVLTAFWAWLLHGERPGAWSIAGCALIFSATVGRALWSARRVRPGA